MPKKEELTAREQVRLEMKKMNQGNKRGGFFSNKFVITFGVIFIIAAFVGSLLMFGEKQQEEAKKAMAPVVDLVPEKVDENGAFRAVQTKNNELSKDAVRVDLFFDPQCPGCGAMDRAIGSDLRELSETGEIDLYLSPVAFLDNSGYNRYSTRATNAVVTVAEESPENLVKYINAIYSEEFQPAEGGADRRTDDDLINEAVEVGVPQDSANKIKNHSYFKWIEETTELQTNRQDLFAGGFSTPSLFLNVEYSEDNKAINFKKLDFSNGSIQDVFNKELKEAKKG